MYLPFSQLQINYSIFRPLVFCFRDVVHFSGHKEAKDLMGECHAQREGILQAHSDKKGSWSRGVMVVVS